MKQIEEVRVHKGNLVQRKYKEKGDILWSPKDGKKRKEIIEKVGLEYKQINLLAAVIAELIPLVNGASDNEVIQNAMTKFAEIEKIRNS